MEDACNKIEDLLRDARECILTQPSEAIMLPRISIVSKKPILLPRPKYIRSRYVDPGS